MSSNPLACAVNGTQDEVEVDKEALVNILSRYPGQFDVLRELIQNADDAESTTIELRFETASASTGKVHKWIVKNKGRFKEEDWRRLGEIAAGNTNSTKVGAFGVGFYSVLSKSDRPLVRSGGKSLQFYKTGEGKLCKKEKSGQVDDGWTSVELELKKQEAPPAFDDLASFLISSVALLAHIHTISVCLDQERILYITKECSSPPVDIPIPEYLTRISPQEALKVDSVQRTIQTITINAQESALSTHSTPPSPCYDPDEIPSKPYAPQDHSTPTPTAWVASENQITHDLYIAKTSVSLSPDSAIREGVESCLKSFPPDFKCQGIYFNSEQHQSFARSTKSSKTNVFKAITPEESNGRLFIGQSTNQTTGIGLHFSSHYLPTMERGAIDLANGQIAAWNKEVLWVSGLLARIIYEEDMRFAESKGSQAPNFGLETMARFSFGPTAPHSGVSQILQDAFFSCSRMEWQPKPRFPVVSDAGICSVSDPHFRQTNNDLSFLETYRVPHSDIKPSQFAEIIKRYEIPAFTYMDIVNEFATGVSQETMRRFFEWWQVTKRSAFSPNANDSIKTAAGQFCQQFASRSILRISKGVDTPLKTIKYYTSFSIDDDLSHPNSIYIDISSGVPTWDAIECFGWTRLSLLDWLRHASTATRCLAKRGDPKVGLRLSRLLMQFALGSELSQVPWDTVAGLIEDIKCIPTQKGLSLPGESYLDEADICQQLPVAKVTDFEGVPSIYTVDRGHRSITPDHVLAVLARVGVQTEVDWEDLVSRLATSASKESNDRLLCFLGKKGVTVSQATDLMTKGMFRSQDHGPQPTTRLHLPDDKIRELGLPVLALPQNSAFYEALCSHDPTVSSVVQNFLGYIGIQGCPNLSTLINNAAGDDKQVRETALRYFLDYFEKHYTHYKPGDYAHIAFIPTQCGSRARFNEVFISPHWGELKLKLASKELRHCDLLKLGIKEHPPIETIIEYFQNAHQVLPNRDTAKRWFKLLSLHGKFSPSDLHDQLSKIPFVPVEDPRPSSPETSASRYYPPKECFIWSPDSKKHHRDIFPFVDFDQEGNDFLESCCAKKSPDAIDLARKMAKGPERYLKALGDDTKLYTDDLRTIASQFDTIPEDIKKKMRNAPMFLGIRQQTNASELLLLPANRVMIGDWESRDFGSHVFLAPDEEVIKKMYHAMGSQFLGAYVRYDIKYSDPLDKGFLTREQIVRGVSRYMSRRDQGKRKEILLGAEGVKPGFRVKVCKSIKTTKTFEPPAEVLAGSVVVGDYKDCCAGFDPTDLTLWLVEDPRQSTQLHNDVAVALCHVLLVTFTPNDVMHLASLITMNEAEFHRMCAEDPEHGELSTSERKGKPWKSVEIKLTLPSSVARTAERFGVRLQSKSAYMRTTATPEDDVQNAVNMCYSSQHSGDKGFSKSGQLHRTTFKKSNNRCKEAHKIVLEERVLENREGQLRFFLAHNVLRRDPPRVALDEFSTLITNLAKVFQLPAETACYIFWADTNDDLMAFNRDQKFLFFNLFHYHKFHFNPKVSSEEKRVVTEWFLIMAHEIAHNRSQDHDEYHGSLTSRLVFTYLPALQKQLSVVA